jgi:hypothetical protein
MTLVVPFPIWTRVIAVAVATKTLDSLATMLRAPPRFVVVSCIGDPVPVRSAQLIIPPLDQNTNRELTASTCAPPLVDVDTRWRSTVLTVLALANNCDDITLKRPATVFERSRGVSPKAAAQIPPNRVSQ